MKTTCLRSPFEWQTPIGYTMAVSLQCILITYVFCITMILVTNGIACYLFKISLTKDLKIILHAIDENSKMKKNRRNLYAQFSEFVDFHSDTKQLSNLMIYFVSFRKTDVFIIFQISSTFFGNLAVSNSLFLPRKVCRKEI